MVYNTEDTIQASPVHSLTCMCSILTIVMCHNKLVDMKSGGTTKMLCPTSSYPPDAVKKLEKLTQTVISAVQYYDVTCDSLSL